MTMAFRTVPIAVVVTADDRIVRAYRTTCAECGVEVANKADRRSHVCPTKAK